MKLRNQLLALFLLLIFIAFGFLFFRNWVVQKPFGIILFVGDGLSTNSLTAARLYEGGANQKLTVDSFRHLALVRNAAADFAVPDAAAAATAIATGVKGNNKAIALDPNGKELASILSMAHEAGRATGIVTTGNLTNPSISAFYAHTNDPADVQGIASQLVDRAKVDIALGGGLAHFTPESKGGLRKDGRDLWLELRSKGYSLVRTKAELENTPVFLTGPLVGMFSDDNMAYSSQVESGSQQPSLSDMVRRAIEFLQTNRHGYLLVVNAALISRAAETNSAEKVLTETIDMDRAIATALEYAGDKTLILAVGQKDVGGLTLNGYPLNADHGVALLGTSASGLPAITWSTGPNGPKPASASLIAQPTPEASPAPSPASGDKANQRPPEPPQNTKAEPAAFGAPVAVDTARDMIAIGSGPGSEELAGFMDNTVIFRILKKGL